MGLQKFSDWVTENVPMHTCTILTMYYGGRLGKEPGLELNALGASSKASLMVTLIMFSMVGWWQVGIPASKGQSYRFEVYAAATKSLQSCLTLCDPMDCNQPGSSVHVILQARILEWVSISFSRWSFWPRDRTHVSCVSCIAGEFFTHWAIRDSKLYTCQICG